MADSVQRLYDALRPLPSAERLRILEASCHDRPELREAVERLLASDGSSVAVDLATREFSTKTGKGDPRLNGEIGPGSILGRYKLLEEIGEGGFGTVYLAQQVETVKRKVALKVIKLGMDTRQVIARFDAERQALAMMDHPHIARALDAGATESGRPYFVMELVRGEPITEFADRRHLSPRERLSLFLQVCQAVQHAHQKGIIHRDLKPNNVLVTTTDDRPHAKVIDFGIAKATNSELTEKTLHTEFQQLIGTPVYMSPEQAERAGLDVDTRTDIYSLGVMLYELLTGTTPFELKRLQSASWSELQRIICDEDPPTMSSRIVALGKDATIVARNRACEPAKLRHALRGDLDWIVMRAMEKDRARRYGTAAELSEDVGRFLRDEPVSAIPPTPWYRFQKYVRRNRVPITIATTLLVGLVTALIVTTSFMFWALHERNLARQEKHRAEAQAQRAERFSNLAGTTFLTAEDVARSSTQWGAEIRALQAETAADDASRIRQECQYATWLVTQASLLKNPQLLDTCVLDLAEVHRRAKQSLGIRDPHFLSLANARVQAALLLKQEPPAEVADLFADVIKSYKETRGAADQAYTDLMLERAVAAILANAGSTLPPAEALGVVAETAGKLGLPIDAKSLRQDAQVRSLVERVNNWRKDASVSQRLSSWLGRGEKPNPQTTAPDSKSNKSVPVPDPASGGGAK